MRLYLIGHDYKYAVEQMLLTMFPEERPEYPAGNPPQPRPPLYHRRLRLMAGWPGLSGPGSRRHFPRC